MKSQGKHIILIIKKHYLSIFQNKDKPDISNDDLKKVLISYFSIYKATKLKDIFYLKYRGIDDGKMEDLVEFFVLISQRGTSEVSLTGAVHNKKNYWYSSPKKKRN